MNQTIRTYTLAIALLLAFWQISAWLAGEAILSDPLTVAKKLVQESQTPKFWKHVGSSWFRVIAALFVSFITAVPIGLALGSSRRADRFARPLIYLTYPVPKIVFMPLIFLVFGIGDLGKIAILTIILFFQLLITTRDAAKAVGLGAKYSMYSLGGTRWDLFIHVIWPASLPAVFTALRIATGTVVAVLFFVESIGTRYGLGFYILDAWGRGDVPQVFVGIVMLAIMGVLLYELFDILERYFCRWKTI